MPGLDLVVGDAPVPLPQGDPQLQAGQVRAEAAVDPAAEGDVAVDLAVEADRVGVGELGLVGVGRADHQHDLVARRGRAAPSSVSLSATRATPMTGVSQRSSSSMAEGMRRGSSTSCRRCSGCWARKANMQSSVAVTVSRPAMRNRKQMSKMSSRLSRSPSTSASSNTSLLPDYVLLGTGRHGGCMEPIPRHDSHDSSRRDTRWPRQPTHDSTLARRPAESVADMGRRPKTTPALIRRAIDDVTACEALAPSEQDSLKVGYLAVIALLDGPRNPGRHVPLVRFTRFWNPDYQLNPEQIQAIWDTWRFFRREPERSRRVIRLLTANWLAYLDVPAGDRPNPNPRIASFDVYAFGPQSPPQARALSPEALDRWFDTAYDAQQVLRYIESSGVQTVEQANHVDFLILLGTELYHRDHGTDPPSAEALVGPYLKSLPFQSLPQRPTLVQ